MTQQRPDYGFERGLSITRIRYGEDGRARIKEHRQIGRALLTSLPNAGQDVPSDERVERQLLDTYTAKGIGGAAVEFAVVGPDDAEHVKYALYGWGGMTRHPVAIGEAQALAAADPESQIVFINTAGAGRTEALPKSIQNEITRFGHYGPLGEHFALATAGLRKGRKVSARGHSLGGRTAIGMVPAIEEGVKDLIVNDPTGSRKVSLFEIADSYLVREALHLGCYVRAGFDPGATERQRSPVSKAIRETQEGRVRGGKWQMFYVDPVGLSRGGFEYDLEQALPNVYGTSRVISPELSELNDWRSIAGVLGRVVENNQPDASVEQWIVEGHAHSFMAAAPAV